MLIKYMGIADYREFYAGDTLGGQAPATPVNIIFSKDIAVDPGDHVIDTTAAFYSGVNSTWWTALLKDPNFLNVTGDSPIPPGAWDSAYGFQVPSSFTINGAIPANLLGAVSGVATLDIHGFVPPSQLGNAIPVGDQSKIGTPIAYNDPYSGDAVKVVTVSAETTVVAIARVGDAYPEIVFRAAGSFTRDTGAPVLAFGDGTFDPVTWGPTDGGGGLSISPIGGSTPYPAGWTISAPNSYLNINATVGHIEGSTIVEQLGIYATQYAQSSVTWAAWSIMVLGGNPNTIALTTPYSGTGLPGNLNDIAVNANASVGGLDWLWRNLTAGGIGAASWFPALIRPLNLITLAANGAVTIDASKGNALVTLQANATSSSITNPLVVGQELKITWIQDSTGGRTYSWPTNCKFGTGVTTGTTIAAGAPTATVANKRSTVTFRWDGTNWNELSRSVNVG